MKVFLLHRDRDVFVKPELCDVVFDAMTSGDPYALTNVRRDLARRKDTAAVPRLGGCDEQLAQDLELETLWLAMAGGDEFVYELAKRVTLSSLADPESIVYRQHVLADCLDHADAVRGIYALALEGLESERATGGLWAGASADLVLSRSVAVLKLYVDVLRRLRALGEREAAAFRSEGFVRFFAMLADELSDEYLGTVERHLHELEFKRGVLESAELGKGLKGRGYQVHRPREESWTERLPFGDRPPTSSFTVHPRDDAGLKALEEIRARGINTVANAVARSADHVKSFFAMLRLELAFYLGCLELHGRLEAKRLPVCVPAPAAPEELAFACEDLRDVCLAFHLEGEVVGNTVDADGRSLVTITGANQGGKSTFLRSVGLAQLMMQSGMFVGARSFRSGVCSGVFTHYRREEEASMEGGKLDEELARMSMIAGRIAPRALLLCNESFASTNEREGSEIARQVVQAMVAKEIRVFFVTHMYDLAHGFHARRLENALFLRAERAEDGTRSFRLAEGEPLPTSYGEDSYRRIFGAGEPARSAAAGAPPV